MTTAFEEFINVELPKRLFTNDDVLAIPAGTLLMATGQGLEVVFTEAGDLPILQQLRSSLDAILADPQNAVTSWELQAKGFDQVQGGATYGAVSARLAGWSMINGSASYITMPLSLPSHWTLVDVYVKWVNIAANAGNVVLGGEIHQWTVGESINVTPAGGSAIVAANPVPWIVSESKVATNRVIDPSRLCTLRIARQGASANDTLANALTILSVRLVKK